MNVDTAGSYLEELGFSDDAIDAYFEHHGVKGMQWGVRRAEKKAGRQQNRALNKASRQADKAKYRSDIDKARANIESGKSQKKAKAAKEQFHKDKKELGSREARKILAKKRAKLQKEYETASQARDGKEVATAMLVGAVAATAMALLTSR